MALALLVISTRLLINNKGCFKCWCFLSLPRFFWNNEKMYIFAPPKRNNFGAIAQLVEQRTENPCVPRSIRGGTTRKRSSYEKKVAAFLLPRISCRNWLRKIC